MKRRFLFGVSLLLLVAKIWCQTNEVQTLRLEAGWNLITFQVLPSDSSPIAIFGSLGNSFAGVWTYDSVTKQWTRYARPGTRDADHNGIATMAAIEFGRAYWVYMDSPVVTWQVQGNAPAITPPIVFTNGWNFVGIPIGASALPEPVNILSVLAASGMDYDILLRWEAAQYDRFTPDDSDEDDFTMFDANKGYWVRLKGQRFVLQPKLLCSVRADVDVEPTNNYPSHEDLRLSPSPFPLGPSNQTHIVFLPGEDSQQIAIANPGGGILLWSLEWQPQDARDVAWLVPSSGRGVTTIENDIIQLQLDRRDLVKGTYRGRLILHTTAGDRAFEVVANVPGLEGEWRGSATIASVNQRTNPLPEIDLHLDFFEDPAIPGLLRGLIDSRNALLWPVDVPLIGHILTDHGNSFLLSGGYVLPPGDQNNPPYDQFKADPEDVDWNCNGTNDAINPYPFPIYRSVTMQGTLTEASPGTGYVIKGSYTEVVFGMLRAAIRLEGEFTIRRENSRPFANRRPVSNAENADGTQPVVLKTYSPNYPLRVPSGRVVHALSFETDMVLESLSVDLDLRDVSGEAIGLTLEAPDGRSVVLHDRDRVNSLRNLSFPNRRQPKQPLSTLINAGVPTRGDWKLVIENFGGLAGNLYSWSLLLQGQPVFDFAGQVVDETTGAALSPEVFLDGLPISEVQMAGADGSFKFSRLPGIPLNLSANLAGFEAPDPARPGLAAAFTTPHFDAECGSSLKHILESKFRALPVLPVPAVGTEGFGSAGTVTNPVVLSLRPRSDIGSHTKLTAMPALGPAPLPVRFTLFAGSSGAIPPGAKIFWDFGDGTMTNGINLAVVEHTYGSPAPAGYTATARINGTTELSVQVLVMPSPGHSSNPLNFFQVHFTGGGTIPADFADALVGTNDVGQPAPFAERVMVQHADCASFDIDRFPFTSPANRNFHADGFPNGAYPTHPSDYIGNFKGEDSNYRISLFEWELAGDCGSAVDDDEFHPHPRPGFTGDCNLRRYRMVCNIGPSILPPSHAEVETAPGSDLPPPIKDPWEKRDEIASARGLRMITGPLSAYWQEGNLR